MEAYFFQGIQIGLGLAILVGPTIVLLVQLSLEEGTLSSLCAASGIWFSDLIYLLLAHFGIGQLKGFIDHPNFEWIICSIGGIVLLTVGISMWWQKPVRFRKELKERKPRYWLAFMKGFAINFFNPFPVFFWSAVSVGIVYKDKLTNLEALVLYGAIMGMIILTDSLKVSAARYLRRWMTPDHTRMTQRIGGIVLVVFGLVLFGRGWL